MHRYQGRDEGEDRKPGEKNPSREGERECLTLGEPPPAVVGFFWPCNTISRKWSTGLYSRYHVLPVGILLWTSRRPNLLAKLMFLLASLFFIFPVYFPCYQPLHICRTLFNSRTDDGWPRSGWRAGEINFLVGMQFLGSSGWMTFSPIKLERLHRLLPRRTRFVQAILCTWWLTNGRGDGCPTCPCTLFLRKEYTVLHAMLRSTQCYDFNASAAFTHHWTLVLSEHGCW